MPYTNQCFLVEVAISTSCSMHTQVVNFHIVMEIWSGQFKFAHYISTDALTYKKKKKKKKKHLILWFMLDLSPLKYLCANMSPYCFLHNCNKQYFTNEEY